MIIVYFCYLFLQKLNYFKSLQANLCIQNKDLLLIKCRLYSFRFSLMQSFNKLNALLYVKLLYQPLHYYHNSSILINNKIVIICK